MTSPIKKAIIHSTAAATFLEVGTALFQEMVSNGHPNLQDMQELFVRQSAGAMVTVPINFFLFLLVNHFCSRDPHSNNLAETSGSLFTLLPGIFSWTFQADLGTALLKEMESSFDVTLLNKWQSKMDMPSMSLGGLAGALMLIIAGYIAYNRVKACTKNPENNFTTSDRVEVVTEGDGVELETPAVSGAGALSSTGHSYESINNTGADNKFDALNSDLNKIDIVVQK